MAEFSESITINASIAEVWATLADIGAIADWNPGVKSSHQTTIGDPDCGSGRRCELGGANYLLEEVVVFDPPQHITFRITETNLPFKSADIHFQLSEQANATAVVVSPRYELKFGAFGRILDTLMVRMAYRKGMRDLLRGLKEHVEAAAP